MNHRRTCLPQVTVLGIVFCIAAVSPARSADLGDSTKTIDSISAAVIAPIGLSAHSPNSADTAIDPYRFWDRYDPNSSVEKSNPTPVGYERISRSQLNGFARWLSRLPLRAPQEPLLRFEGDFLLTPDRIGGVIDINVNSPAEDARGILYRLMMEFTRHTERELEMQFATKSLDTAKSANWFTGTYKTNADRSKLIFTPGSDVPLDEIELLKFTYFAISVTNYKSLIRDCREIPEDSVLPGDIFVQYDSTVEKPFGHVSICLDVALQSSAPSEKSAADGSTDWRASSPRLYLYGNCLTPATNFHIVRPLEYLKGSWFSPGELAGKLAGIGPGRYFRLPYKFLR